MSMMSSCAGYTCVARGMKFQERGQESVFSLSIGDE